MLVEGEAPLQRDLPDGQHGAGILLRCGQARQGVELPRVSSQQATAGTAVASLAEARPGDLLFFDYSADRPGIDHVGIHQGGGMMIAAPQPGDVVKVQPAGAPSIIRRVLPTGPG